MTECPRSGWLDQTTWSSELKALAPVAPWPGPLHQPPLMAHTSIGSSAVHGNHFQRPSVLGTIEPSQTACLLLSPPGCSSVGLCEETIIIFLPSSTATPSLTATDPEHPADPCSSLQPAVSRSGQHFSNILLSCCQPNPFTSQTYLCLSWFPLIPGKPELTMVLLSPSFLLPPPSSPFFCLFLQFLFHFKEES